MAIVRKDKLQAGYNGNLESVKIHDNEGSLQVAATNGVFVVVEGLMEGEREVKKARLAAEKDIAHEVLLVHNAEVMYDAQKSRLDEYEIEAGKVARAYYLANGDIITLTVDLFHSEPSVNDVLAVKADGKLGEVEGEAKVAFKVIEDAGHDLALDQKAYAVQVVR